MPELILSDEEINVLKDLKNSMDKTKILHNLNDYGLINATFTDDTGCIFANLSVNGQQLLKALEEHKGLLDKFKFQLDLGVIKIETK